jgi:FKBP-type peptidyl-prolyl cis-trans isomerase
MSKYLVIAACVFALACEQKKDAAKTTKAAATKAGAASAPAKAGAASAPAKGQGANANPMPTGPIAAPPDVAAAPKDAKVEPSGLASKVLAKGTGDYRPKPHDKVSVHYTGWTTDGKMFDSSVTRGAPATFGLNQVIPGWTEGVGLMVKGEKRRLWIPEEMAYKGRRGAPQGMLVFDVEVLEIVKGTPPLAAPDDVQAAPKDAKKTKSGLAYKVMKKATGKGKPVATDMVVVHYTGWTTDGKQFDSSVQRGQPATFPLNRVIPGWTEGVQLMTVGEKTRFWIPQDLAYKGRPGPPAGMLVFDIELLAIKKPGPPPTPRPMPKPAKK